MSGDTRTRFDILSLSEAELVDAACDRFETVWREGDYPCLEGYLDAVPDTCRAILAVELIKLEIELRGEVGERPTAEEYGRRFPDHAAAIHQIFHEIRKLARGRSTSFDDRIELGAAESELLALPASTTGLEPGQLNDPTQIDAAIGRQLGDYLIREKIGSGGQGVVYRAFERKSSRDVALKLIKADWLGDSTDANTHNARARFRNEAQAHAMLNHDHIVPVYRVGEVGGLLFIAMRLIKGRSLGQMVLSDGPLAPRRAAYYIEPIARAIQYAHDQSLLHRDVKPANVLVGDDDRPYLIDLGLASCLEATDYTSLSGKALGTPAYMSPEQARGQKNIRFATDIYGLGATLYTILTGRPPFPGENPVVILRQVVDVEPAWPRERDKIVGPELKAICLKCLEKDPAHRFATAGELADELKRYLAYERCHTKAPGPVTQVKKWARRQPWRAVAAALGVAAAIILASAWVGIARRDQLAADNFVRDVLTTPLSQLPAKIEQNAGYHGLVKPRLRALLANTPPNTELRTRLVLALSPSEPERVNEAVDRLFTCEPDEHRAICVMLRDRSADVAPRLRQVVSRPETEAGTRTRAAAALIALERPDRPETLAWSLLRLDYDPTTRVELLHWLVQMKIEAHTLADHLDAEPDVSVRRQVIQALGVLGHGQPPPGLSAAWPARLVKMYSDDPDPGVHSSLAYLLRRWGMDSDQKTVDLERTGMPRDDRKWYVNSMGMTMAIITVPADGRPLPPEPGAPPPRFAVATTETPLALFQQFDPAHAARRNDEYDKLPETHPEAPADVVSYFDAARFCNWLSERDHIPPDQWCYQPGEGKLTMVLAEDYLNRRGYRLPTRPEWEFAARAGTATDCYFGKNMDRVTEYAWVTINSNYHTQPVGRLRPNDLGLFDVLGNVAEWCRNPITVMTPVCTPSMPGMESETRAFRLESLNGGKFTGPDRLLGVRNRSPLLRAALPFSSLVYAGFRVVQSDF